MNYSQGVERFIGTIVIEIWKIKLKERRNGENNVDIFKSYENVIYTFNIVRENGEDILNLPSLILGK